MFAVTAISQCNCYIVDFRRIPRHSTPMAALDPVLSWLYFIILCIISVISLLTNGIVLTWKPSSPDVQCNLTRLVHLLTSQALANLTTAVVIIPVWLFILIMEQKKHISFNLEKIDDICFYSFDVFHQLLTVLHLVVIATERLCAICWPVMHRTAPDRTNYIASITPWLIASSASSIVMAVYYFTKMPVLVTLTSIGSFGFPCFIIFAILLVISFRLFGKVLTPSKKIDVSMTKGVAVIIFCYFIISLPYHTISLLKFFCSSCNLSQQSLSLGLPCLFYSSSAVIPAVFISLVPQLRAKVQWYCFRFHAINEQSRNELYMMEIPGIQSRTKCILVNAVPMRQDSDPAQDDIYL